MSLLFFIIGFSSLQNVNIYTYIFMQIDLQTQCISKKKVISKAKDYKQNLWFSSGLTSSLSLTLDTIHCHAWGRRHEVLVLWQEALSVLYLQIYTCLSPILSTFVIPELKLLTFWSPKNPFCLSVVSYVYLRITSSPAPSHTIYLTVQDCHKLVISPLLMPLYL